MYLIIKFILFKREVQDHVVCIFEKISEPWKT